MPDGQNQQNQQGEAQQFSTDLKVEIGGSEIKNQDVHAVVVEQDLDQPDMAQITLDDSSRERSGNIKIGDEVKVTFGRKGESDDNQVFKGEVVGLEPRYSSEGESKVTVRAFDLLHRLVRGRNSRAWEDTTEKQVLEDILNGPASPGNTKGYGLSLDTDIEAPVVHAYQHNQTDYEFLLYRAKMYGARIWLEDTKVCVKKPDFERDFRPDIVLELKAKAKFELKQFSPRLSAAEVLSEVEVRGWDPVKKEEIVGTAKADEAPHGRLGEYIGDKALQTFGRKKSFSVDSPVFSKEEADNKARSLLYDSLMDFITGTGVVVGRSALGAGQVVEIKLYKSDGSLDEQYRFNGKYLLTGVTHRYTREKTGNVGGYLTLIRYRRDAAASAGGSSGGSGGSGGGNGRG